MHLLEENWLKMTSKWNILLKSDKSIDDKNIQ